jgi:heat shock protein HslJ
VSFAIRHILFSFALGLLCLQAWAADESQEKSASFSGTEWHLTQVIFDGAVSALEYGSGSPVTIKFDRSGRVSGRGPINHFTGAAKWSDDGSIAWVGAGLQTTSMAGPPDAMEREDLFFQILGQVQRHRISGSQLILETDDANSSLVFDR